MHAALINNSPEYYGPESRDEREEILGVELKFMSLPFYLFKLKGHTEKGFSFLVKDGSLILGQLDVGHQIEARMRYSKTPEMDHLLICVIEHITKADDGYYQGHYIVGVRLVDGEGGHSQQRE